MEDISMILNEQTTYQPYLYGKLFAILEAIQLRAKPGYNATINHFSMAGTRPRSIFPRLLILNEEMYMKMLDRDVRAYYDKLLCELIGKITEFFPEHLSLQDKGTFQLGYFHQKQILEKDVPEKVDKTAQNSNENEDTKDDV